MLPKGKVIHVTVERPVAREITEEDSILAIWKTLTWRAIFDMLLGMLIIVYLSIGFILVFGE